MRLLFALFGNHCNVFMKVANDKNSPSLYGRWYFNDFLINPNYCLLFVDYSISLCRPMLYECVANVEQTSKILVIKY